jgi:pimeloyl-ACP methyl ester carboxylesterase
VIVRFVFYISILLTPIYSVADDLLPCTDDSDACKGDFFPETDAIISYYRNFAIRSQSSSIRRVIIVIHGLHRKAPLSFGAMVRSAQATGHVHDTLILAPLFPIAGDEVRSNELFWQPPNAWAQGDRSQNLNRRLSSFEVIDRMIERVLTYHTKIESIAIVGHSAGGQFVQRYAGGTQIETRVENINFHYYVMNPSSYLYLNNYRPTPGETDFAIPANVNASEYNRYRYGLDDRNNYMRRISRSELIENYVSRNVHYVLGEKDNDPNHEDLARNCAAMLQGTNRLERGILFLAHMNRFFSNHKHLLTVVPNAAHSSNQMYNSPEVRALLFR